MLPIITRWLNNYAARAAERRSIAHLRSLNDRQLKDIGVARGGIKMAVRDQLR